MLESPLIILAFKLLGQAHLVFLLLSFPFLFDSVANVIDLDPVLEAVGRAMRVSLVFPPG